MLFRSNALDDDGNPIKKSTAQKVTPEKNKSQEAPEKVQSGGAEMTTDAMGNITGQSNTFEQVPTGGNTQRLNTAMAENVNALLTKQKADDNVTVNNIAKSVGKKTQEIAKLNEIAVRNDEPTLLRMIMNSTSFV